MIPMTINLILYAVHVLFLPEQIYSSYIELKIDRTRLRYLLVAASIDTFSALWVATEVWAQFDPHVGTCLLIYSGILLISLIYYYISRELGLRLKNLSVLCLLLGTMHANL